MRRRKGRGEVISSVCLSCECPENCGIISTRANPAPRRPLFQQWWLQEGCGGWVSCLRPPPSIEVRRSSSQSHCIGDMRPFWISSLYWLVVAPVGCKRVQPRLATQKNGGQHGQTCSARRCSCRNKMVHGIFRFGLIMLTVRYLGSLDACWCLDFLLPARSLHQLCAQFPERFFAVKDFPL